MSDAISTSLPPASPADQRISSLSGQFRDANQERLFRTEYGHILLQRDRFIFTLIIFIQVSLILVDYRTFYAVPDLKAMRLAMRLLYMGTLLIAYFHYKGKSSYSVGTQGLVFVIMLVHNLFIATYHHPYLMANTSQGFLFAVYLFTIAVYYTFLTASLPGTLLATLCLVGQYLLLDGWMGEQNLTQTYAPFLLFSLIAFSHYTASSQMRQHRLTWLAAQVARNHQRRAEELQVFRTRLLELVGHDLHQPLGALRYHIATLRISAASLTDRDAERSLLLADHVSRTADEITDMLDKVIELAQLDNDDIASRCRIQPVAPLIKELRKQFDSSTVLAGVELHIHGSRRQVVHDPILLLAVLRNLIRNAIAYHRQTARPRVVLAFRGSRRGEYIEIIDNGGGLTEDVMSRLNDTAHMPAQGQHGLGLMIARQLALKQGWRMDIDNWPGRGVRFRICYQAPRTP